MANEISKVKLPNDTTEYPLQDDQAIASISRSGTTFTATRRDGTSFTFTQQDNNTTYTFATGDNNGQIKVTPSGGTAQNVSVKGLGAAAYKGTTTSVTSGSSDLVTSGAVYTAIDNLPEPMIFKGSLGTGGTITTLPTASSANEGFTYKVITAGTYASQVAKVGDLFISNGTDWIWIPSGDEPSGTVTSVAISNGGGLSVSGSPITSSGTITISHADTSSQASVDNSGRTYIQDITLDTYGHVTKITSATETVVNTDRYVNSAAFANDTSGVKMTLTRAGSDTATVTGTIPLVSSSTAGVAPKGTAVSSQSQSTKFLREDGSWAAPSYTTNTNTTYTLAAGTGDDANKIILTPSSGTANKITVPYATYASSATTVTRTETNPTQYTTYNLIWNTGSTGLGWNDGLSYATLQGTTSVEGYAYLNVGNNIATGTTGNKTGVIRLYSEAGGYAAIKSNSTITGNVTVNIKTSGTVGAFTSAPTSGQVVITDGTDGGIKTLGYTIAKSVPSDAKFTDTTYTFTNKNATLAWSTTSTIATVGGVDIKVTMPANPNTNTTYTLSADTTNNQIKLTPSSGNAQSITVPYATSAGNSTTVSGTYSGNGGQQPPNYYGKNKVGFLMSNATVAGDNHYKNWIYMDNYNGTDVGGATAFGIDRTECRAFIMQSDANRTSWNNTAALGVFTATPTSGQVVITDGTTGGIKSSGYTIAKSVPSDAVFTDTNTHRPIQVNGTEILGNNTTALNLKAGSNVSVTNSSGTVTIAATDTNTTYTLGADTTNNKITLTPSSGTAQSITVPYATSAGGVAWGNVTGKPSTFTPASHTHGITDITWAGNANLKANASANNQEWSIDLTPGSYTGTYWQVWSAKNSKTILACYTDNNKVEVPNGDFYVTNGEVSVGYGIELGTASKEAAAHIDFHWNSSSGDYTARIWQRGESTVDLIGKNSSTWGIWRAGSFSTQSSIHAKENIQDITIEDSRKLLQLRPVTFNYKNGGLTDQAGLIAEEVYLVMPKMVIGDINYNPEEPWNTPSIDYSKFTPYLIKMVQEQQKEIDELKEMINQ